MEQVTDTIEIVLLDSTETIQEEEEKYAPLTYQHTANIELNCIRNNLLNIQWINSHLWHRPTIKIKEGNVVVNCKSDSIIDVLANTIPHKKKHSKRFNIELII